MSELRTLRSLTRDGRLILLSRSLRLFAFGALSVILVLYFSSLGWSTSRIGRVLSLTMIGDAVVTLAVTFHADRIGRRRMLQFGALLMVLVGVLLPLTTNVWIIAPIAFFGAISLNGGEVGPFLAIEQAALTHSLGGAANRTTAIAWYVLFGALSTALGALASGFGSYRVIFAIYAACGGLLFAIFSRLSRGIEPVPNESIAPRFGLHESRGIVLRLAGLFMLDTFASGLAVQSFLAYWLHRRFGADTAAIGGIFFGFNLLAAFSALAAGRIAARIGLINTMVWTHIPANLLLISLPLMPSLPFAIAVILLRGCLSQMDVPARQSYLMAVVDPGERSAAGGVAGLAKSLASAISPPITGALFAAGWLSAPLFAAGALKIIYDLVLWRGFRRVRPPEEE
jgi:predicted MFS family arabinose efflux permease